MKHKHQIKLITFILTVILTFGPAVPAFAIETAEDNSSIISDIYETPSDESSEVEAETGNADSADDFSAAGQDTSDNQDADNVKTTGDDNSSDGENTYYKAESDEDIVADEAAMEAAAGTPEDSDPIVVDNLPDTDDLIEGYIENEAEEELGEKSHIKSTRRKYLDGQSAAIYDILKEEIQKIAKGERHSTIVEVPVEDFMDPIACTATDLGLSSITTADGSDVSKEAMDKFHDKVLTVNVAAISRALQADMPYDLYWYNKADDGTGGIAPTKPSVTLDGESVVFEKSAVYKFKFRVSSNYRSEGSDYTSYMVDSYKISATNTAAAKAAAIVDEVSTTSSTDYDKLISYRDKICQLVSYNYDAPSPKKGTETAGTYGNPWQLIWVFDEDTTTNVVCEGYAKAFKFLCDLTDFNSSNIDCRLVTGPLTYYVLDKSTNTYEKTTENHMWNVVRMNDGLNYMVDVTNCDAGTKGYPDKLFLKGDSKRSGTGYSFWDMPNTMAYSYDGNTMNQFTDSERTLAAKDYAVGTADADKVNDAIEHDHYLVSDKNAKAPTCTQNGKTASKHCSICRETVVKSEVIPALGHDFGEWTHTDDPTCTEAGSKERTCTVCDYKETADDEPALGHDYGDWVSTDDEHHSRICAHDDSHVETAEHAWDEGEVTTEPTCTDEGVKTFTCSVCGGTKTEIIPAAHKYGEWESVDDEHHSRTCAHDDSHVETVEHDWDEGKITTEATCTEDGVKTFTCKDCGFTKTESVDALGHAYGEWTIADTDDEHHIMVCAHDDSHIVTEDHAWNEGVVTPATCTDKEIKTYTCTVCGATKVEELSDKLGHDYGNWVSVDDDHHSITCTHDISHVETGDHEWNEGEVTTEPTCTEDGVKTYTCSVCGGTKTEVIPDTGHKYGEWTVEKAATYDAEGQQKRVCSVCDEPETRTIAKLPRKSIASANVSGLKALTYTGKALTQAPTVTLGGATLTNGTDYTCTYKNNVNAGTATITFTGKGAYEGSLSKTFKINAKAVTPSVTLSASAYTYNGGVKKPGVTVKIGSTKLAASGYTVTYAAGRKNVGKYNVTVKLKGNYSGSKTVSFKINPKGSSVSKLAAVKKGFNVTWARQKTKMSTSVITGYQIQYSTNKKFSSGNKTITVKGYNSATKAIRKLASKKTYYVRIRTYKTVSKVNYYSGWSAAKAVKTK